MTAVLLGLENDPVDPEAIDVWLDGHVGDEPCRFRLDTGAGTCRVRRTEATRGLPSGGMSRGVAASGVVLGEDEIVIPLLRLGDHHLLDVEATRTPIDIDAGRLLGMSALIRHRCQLARRPQRAQRTPTLQSIEKGRHYEPMLVIVGMPLIQLADWDFDFPSAKWGSHPTRLTTTAGACPQLPDRGLAAKTRASGSAAAGRSATRGPVGPAARSAPELLGGEFGAHREVLELRPDDGGVNLWLVRGA